MPQITTSSGVGSSIQTSELDDNSVTLAKLNKDTVLSRQSLFMDKMFFEIIQGANLTITAPISGQRVYPSVTSSTNLVLNDGAWLGYVLLHAGTYTVKVFSETHSTNGISTYYLDSDSIGTADWYSAGDVYKVTKTLSTTYSVATTGVYRVKFIMTSKHASATNYNHVPEIVYFERTA